MNNFTLESPKPIRSPISRGLSRADSVPTHFSWGFTDSNFRVSSVFAKWWHGTILKDNVNQISILTTWIFHRPLGRSGLRNDCSLVRPLTGPQATRHTREVQTSTSCKQQMHVCWGTVTAVGPAGVCSLEKHSTATLSPKTRQALGARGGTWCPSLMGRQRVSHSNLQERNVSANSKVVKNICPWTWILTY